MASIIIAPLTDVLDETALSLLSGKLLKREVNLRDQTDDLDHSVENDFDDEILAEFMSDLEDEYDQADIYVPGIFSDIIPVGELRVGSLEALIEALETLQDGLGIDDPDGSVEEEDISYDDEDDDYLDRMEISRLGLKALWYDMYRIANAALEIESNMIIRRE
ncbi:hypothetical protein KKF84_01385 [Myxococcota bacterium]|nr:hypothetical protein [Myxococcota bacterium]